MEGPRTIKFNELNSAINLSNSVFRINAGRKPTMHLEFPHLFSKDNAGNIMAFFDNNNVASMMAMYYYDMIYYGCNLKISCLGSVCTDPEYRGNGLATKLLKACEDKMDNDDIDICIISGGRGLYVNNGYKKIGKVYHVTFNKECEFNDSGYDIKKIDDINEDSVRIIHKIYENEPIRFVRPLTQFEDLLKTASFSNVIMGEQRIYIAYKNDIPVSYIIYSRLDDKKGQMIEYVGNIDGVMSAISYIMKNDDIDKLEFWFFKDDFRLLNISDAKEESLPGTVKIINKERFLEKMSLYLKENLKDDDYNNFLNLVKSYKQNSPEFTELMFCDTEDVKENELLNKVLPLNFVWTHGLNYI